MKLSEKRTTELFNAICEPITKHRITWMTEENSGLDNALFQLQMEIWREVKLALNLKEPS